MEFMAFVAYTLAMWILHDSAGCRKLEVAVPRSCEQSRTI